jgi:hypothetical protein
MAGCVVMFRIMVMDVYYFSLYYLGNGRVEGRRWNLAAWIYTPRTYGLLGVRHLSSTARKINDLEVFPLSKTWVSGA